MATPKFETCFVFLSILFVKGALARFKGFKGDVQEVVPELKSLFQADLDTWEAPEEIRKKFVYYQTGFDEEDQPVWVQELGKWDIRAAVETGGKYLQDFDKYCDQWIYRILNSTYHSATPENPVTQVISIHDMEGYNIQQLSHAQTVAFIAKKCAKLGASMKIMDAGYMLNVNFVAERLLQVIKPYFGPNVARMETYGTNKGRWMPLLLQKISKQQLPEWYGGQKDFKPYKVYG